MKYSFFIFLLVLIGCKSTSEQENTNNSAQSAEAITQPPKIEQKQMRCPDESDFPNFVGKPLNEFMVEFPKLKFRSFFQEPPGIARGIYLVCNGNNLTVYLEKKSTGKWFSQDANWKLKDFEAERIEVIYAE